MPDNLNLNLITFKRLFVLHLLIIFSVVAYGQKVDNTTWWNPAESDVPVIEGQGWPDAVKAPFDRLPAKAEGVVRDAVWHLSRHSADLVLRFYTNASEITVRYGIEGSPAMWHMPSTGVSGVDLYAISSDGTWQWCRGRRQGADTISYQFTELRTTDGYHDMGREYRLYLPLYARTTWLEIGVPEGTYFEPVRVRPDQPIVVYGTSIAQGGCASRSGNGWVGMVGRRMDRPMINLAFSGNGLLEPELIDMISEIDARIYVLDCLPNLVNEQKFSSELVRERILHAVKTLKSRRANTPILLTEHAGYSDAYVNEKRDGQVKRVNNILRDVFGQLKQEGVQDIYLLSKSFINMSLDGTVDGTHPNDIGMLDYAVAYEKILRIIFHEPAGMGVTTYPVVQRRDRAVYEWEERHRAVLETIRNKEPENVIVGNSIIHFWGGEPASPKGTGRDSWEKYLKEHNTLNLGYGWDRIENVLWRVYHGELDHFQANTIVVMIGTNNLYENSDEEILDGLDLLIRAIKVRQPEARITMAGILPRRAGEDRVKTINGKIQWLTYNLEGVQFVDLGNPFLTPEGKVDESLFTDGLHPNAEGYRLLAREIDKIMMNKK